MLSKSGVALDGYCMRVLYARIKLLKATTTTTLKPPPHSLQRSCRMTNGPEIEMPDCKIQNSNPRKADKARGTLIGCAG